MQNYSLKHDPVRTRDALVTTASEPIKLLIAICMVFSSASYAQIATQLTPLSTVPEVKATQDGVIAQPQIQPAASVKKGEPVDFKMTIGGGSESSATSTTTSTTSSTTSSFQQLATAPTVASPPRPKIPNSIAVTDFSVKNEYQDFFYDEKASSKGSFNGNSNFGPTGGPVQPGVEAGTPAPPTPPAPVTYSGTASVSANSEFSYSKNYGTKRTISYSEIRGITADIKATLLKAGYKVVQSNPVLTTEKLGEEYLDLKARIERGDFGDAQYILQGNIINIDIRSTNDQIPGTSDYAYRLEYSLLAEFTLINTETFEVSAAFNAMGSGQDMYLGKHNAKFVPKMNKITKEMLVSFGREAEKNLYEQLPPLNKKESGIGSLFSSKQQEAAGVGDPSTLKVYKSGKNNDTGKEVSTDIPLTIYKK